MVLESSLVLLLKLGKKLAKVCFFSSFFLPFLLLFLFLTFPLIMIIIIIVIFLFFFFFLDAAKQGTQAGKGGRAIFQQGKGMELEEAKKILGIEAMKAPTYDSIMEVTFLFLFLFFFPFVLL